MGKPNQASEAGKARQSSMDKQVNAEGHKAMDHHAQVQHQTAVQANREAAKK